MVREGDIFFLVLNRADNDFDPKVIETISQHLDTVAAAKGARVLVTIGTGPKYFSTGFNLNHYYEDPINWFTTPTQMISLYKKLLVL